MRIVQRYGDIEHMAAHHTPRCVIIRGGDEYLNRLAARRHARQWLDAHPDSELIELEAKDSSRYDFEEATSPSLLSPSAAVIVNHAEDCDEPLAQPDSELIELEAKDSSRYDFEEATSPSLLSPSAAVIVNHAEDCDEPLAQAITDHCRNPHGEADGSLVIVSHNGSAKGKRLIDSLTRLHAVLEDIPKLDKPQARLNFTLQGFEQRGRTVEPQAAQQLASVLGERPGELAAMIEQLCFDFDTNPITLSQVNQYLISDPQVTGFAMADQALAGHGAQAVIMMRSAISQGTEPIALIGALAMKLRSMAKASAVRAGTITQAESNMAPWMLRNASKQLPGWTSAGMAQCFSQLAWADEQCKTNGSDPIYALEHVIELISRKGIA